MENGKQPVLTGVIQSAEKDPKKRKILGRIALWSVEKRSRRRTPSSNESEADEMFTINGNGKVILKRCPVVM